MSAFVRPNETFNLFVTHIESAGNLLVVWGQRDRDAALAIEQTIFREKAAFLEGKGAVDITEVRVGQLCCAAYEDNTFYRARVIYVDAKSRKVSVLFVDYGNVETVSISAIRSVAGVGEPVADTPQLGTSYLVSRLLSNWTKEKLELVSELLKYGEFCCNFDTSDSVRSPPLIKIMYMGGDFAEYMASHGLGSYVPVQQYEGHIRPAYSGTTNVPNNPNPMWQRMMPADSMASSSNIPSMMNGTGPVMNHQMPPSGMPHMGPPSLGVPGPVRNQMAPPMQSVSPRLPPPGLGPAPSTPAQMTAPPTAPIRQFIRMKLPPQKPSQYKSCVLEPGVRHPVFVSHVEDGPLAFSVQLLESHPQLESLMQQINSRNPEPVSGPLHAGLMCLARFMGDMSLCRALILFTTEENRTCKVYYVDYGNTDVVPYTHIFAIPLEFASLKVLSYRFALRGVDSECCTIEEKKMFKELVQSMEATLVVAEPDGVPNKHLGDLFIEGKNVKLLLKEKLKKKTVLLRYPKVQLPREGSKNEVTISFVEEFHKFFVQLSVYSDSLNNLMESVYNHCTGGLAQPLTEDEKIPAMPCCAMYTDGNWYRAVILNCFGDDVVVMYVDYGNEAKVKFSDLVNITVPLVSQLPVQAIPCLLHEGKNLHHKLKEFEGQPFTMHVVCQKDAYVTVRLCDSKGNDVLGLSAGAKPHQKTQVVSDELSEVAPAQQHSFNDGGKSRSLEKSKALSPSEDSGINEDQSWRKPGRAEYKCNNEDSFKPKRQFGRHDDRNSEDDPRNGGRFGDRGDRPRGGFGDGNRERSRGFGDDNKGGFRDRGDSGSRFGDSGKKPRGGFGDGGDKPNGGFGDRGGRFGDSGDKPRGSFGDGGSRFSDNGDGGEKRRGGFGDRGGRFGDSGDKPRRGFGDRGSRFGDNGDGGEKLKGSFGDSGDRGGRFGDSGDKPRGGFGDRGDRRGGDREEGGGRFGGKGGRFGDRNEGGGRFGDRGGNDGGRSGGPFGGGGFVGSAPAATPTDAAPAFPFTDLEGKSEDVCFVCGDQSKFFVHKRPENPEFTQLQENIASTYSEVKPSLGSGDVKVGLLCIAFSVESQGWYRARVLNSIEGGAHVAFTDYGNEEDVLYENLKTITADLKTLPPQAIPCTLRGVPVKEWSEDEISDFATFAEAELRATFVELNNEIFSTVITNTVGQTANEKYGATPESLLSLAASYFVSDMTLESGYSAQVEVSWFINPSRFYIQFQSSKTDLVNLLQSIQDNFKNLKPLKTCEPGWFVLARSKDDKVVYRAQVKKADSPNEIGVEFIDYGNGEVMGIGSVYSMEPDYTSLPRQAVRSKLDGVAPVGEAWPVAGSSDLDNSFMGELTCSVNRIDEHGVLMVSLNRNGVDVAAELVEKDHAVYKDPAGVETQEIDMDLLPGQVVCGRVTHVNTEDKRLWVALEKTVADQLQEQVALCTAEPETLIVFPDESIVNGEWSIVLTSLSKYLRAEIIDSTCASGVLVRLVDVGILEEVSPDKIYCLPEAIANTRGQATEFVFDGNAEEGKEVMLRISSTDDGYSATIVGEDLCPLPILRRSAKVYVPYTNGSSVWIHLVSFEENLADLMNNLFEAYDSMAEDSFTPAEGSLCAAKSVKDETWYRSKITAVTEEGVEVFYVDYGSTEVLPKENLRELLPDLKGHAFAREMQLTINSTEDLSPEITELTANVTLDAEFATQNGQWQIELMIGGVKLSKSLIDLGKATRRDDCFFPVEFTAYLAHMESLNEIYVHDEQDLANLQGLQAELQTLAETLEDGSQEAGSLCLALFKDDGMWYRAEILADGRAQFIDYGNSDNVDQVKRLPEDKLQLKRYAVKCSLNAPEGREWTPEDFSRAAELPCEAITVKVLEDGDPKVVEMAVGGRDVKTELVKGVTEELPPNDSGDAAVKELPVAEKYSEGANGAESGTSNEESAIGDPEIHSDKNAIDTKGSNTEEVPEVEKTLSSEAVKDEISQVNETELLSDQVENTRNFDQVENTQVSDDVKEELPSHAKDNRLPKPTNEEDLTRVETAEVGDPANVENPEDAEPAYEEHVTEVEDTEDKEPGFEDQVTEDDDTEDTDPAYGGQVTEVEDTESADKEQVTKVEDTEDTEPTYEEQVTEFKDTENTEPAYEEHVTNVEDTEDTEPMCKKTVTMVESTQDAEPAHREPVTKVEDTEPAYEEQVTEVEDTEDTDPAYEEQVTEVEDTEDTDPAYEEQVTEVGDTEDTELAFGEQVTEVGDTEDTELAFGEQVTEVEDTENTEPAFGEPVTKVEGTDDTEPAYEEQVTEFEVPEDTEAADEEHATKVEETEDTKPDYREPSAKVEDFEDKELACGEQVTKVENAEDTEPAYEEHCNYVGDSQDVEPVDKGNPEVGETEDTKHAYDELSEQSEDTEGAGSGYGENLDEFNDTKDPELALQMELTDVEDTQESEPSYHEQTQMESSDTQESEPSYHEQTQMESSDTQESEPPYHEQTQMESSDTQESEPSYHERTQAESSDGSDGRQEAFPFTELTVVKEPAQGKESTLSKPADAEPLPRSDSTETSARNEEALADELDHTVILEVSQEVAFSGSAACTLDTPEETKIAHSTKTEERSHETEKNPQSKVPLLPDEAMESSETQSASEDHHGKDSKDVREVFSQIEKDKISELRTNETNTGERLSVTVAADIVRSSSSDVPKTVQNELSNEEVKTLGLFLEVITLGGCTKPEQSVLDDSSVGIFDSGNDCTKDAPLTQSVVQSTVSCTEMNESQSTEFENCSTKETDDHIPLGELLESAKNMPCKSTEDVSQGFDFPPRDGRTYVESASGVLKKVESLLSLTDELLAETCVGSVKISPNQAEDPEE